MEQQNCIDMKNYLLALTLFVTLFSCKKETVSPDNTANVRLEARILYYEHRGENLCNSVSYNSWPYDGHIMLNEVNDGSGQQDFNGSWSFEKEWPIGTTLYFSAWTYCDKAEAEFRVYVNDELRFIDTANVGGGGVVDRVSVR